MTKPITQDVNVNDGASGPLKDIAQAGEQVTEQTKQQGKAAEETGESQGLLNQALAGGVQQLASMASGFIGVNGILAMYDAYNERIERTIELQAEEGRIVRENAEARLNAAALRGSEEKGDLQRIEAYAAFAGRSPQEIARVDSVLTSQFPNADPEEINSLMLEVVAAAQLTDASTADLAGGLSAIYRETGDAQAASNIFQEAIQQAGESDPGRLAQELGKFIGVGQQIGGLDAGQAAGFAAAGTGLGLPNEIATTGLKNVAFSIRGKGTPEGNVILDELGVDRDDLILAIQQIASAYQAGDLDAAGLESLGGREAAPVFASLTDPTKLQNFLASVQAVDAAEDYQGRIVTDKARGIFTPGSIQAFNLIAKQAEAQSESVRASSEVHGEAEAAKAQFNLLIDQQVAGGQTTLTHAEKKKENFAWHIGRGLEPGEAAILADRMPDALVTFPNPFTLESQSIVPDYHGSPEDTMRRLQRIQNPDDPSLIENQLEDALKSGPAIDADSVINENSQSGLNIHYHMHNHGSIYNNAMDPGLSHLELVPLALGGGRA